MNNQNSTALRSIMIYIDMFKCKSLEDVENAINSTGNQGSDDTALLYLQLEATNSAFIITEWSIMSKI